jgi:hypothetical protein
MKDYELYVSYKNKITKKKYKSFHEFNKALVEIAAAADNKILNFKKDYIVLKTLNFEPLIILIGRPKKNKENKVIKDSGELQVSPFEMVKRSFYATKMQKADKHNTKFLNNISNSIAKIDKLIKKNKK